MLSLRIGKSKLTFRFAIGNHSLVMKENHIKWDKWLLYVYERTAADAASIIFRRWRVDLVGDVDMITGVSCSFLTHLHIFPSFLEDCSCNV